jgi:hypothetical protein|tara:strand:+ start:1460 stop:1651 length:192 start_codon:yes stop_codon:yes gene_type:complete
MRRWKKILIWLRRHGLLCKKYVYTPPKTPRIQSTVNPGPVDFNEIYENLRKHQEEKKFKNKSK